MGRLTYKRTPDLSVPLEGQILKLSRSPEGKQSDAVSDRAVGRQKP